MSSVHDSHFNLDIYNNTGSHTCQFCSHCISQDAVYKAVLTVLDNIWLCQSCVVNSCAVKDQALSRTQAACIYSPNHGEPVSMGTSQLQALWEYVVNMLINTTHLHANIEVTHFEQHVLVLLQIPMSAPHVEEPQQQVKHQQCCNDNLHDQGQGLQVAVLQVTCTVWVCPDGCTPHWPHLIICSNRPTQVMLCGQQAVFCSVRPIQVMLCGQRQLSAAADPFRLCFVGKEQLSAAADPLRLCFVGKNSCLQCKSRSGDALCAKGAAYAGSRSRGPTGHYSLSQKNIC